MNMNVEMLAAFSLDMYPGAGSLDHLVASLLLILRTHTEHASDSGSVNLNSTIFCFFFNLFLFMCTWCMHVYMFIGTCAYVDTHGQAEVNSRCLPQLLPLGTWSGGRPRLSPNLALTSWLDWLITEPQETLFLPRSTFFISVEDDNWGASGSHSRLLIGWDFFSCFFYACSLHCS